MKKSIRGLKQYLGSRVFRAGGYSVAAAAAVIAIAVIVNMAVSKLPSKYTQFDLTENQMFTLSEQTENILSSLEEDVTVYWLVQDGAENSYLQKLLNVYTGSSSFLKVVKKDPVLYPNFASEYTSETLYDNSLIVVSGERSKTVSSSDIFPYDLSNYYTTGEYSQDFDGEACLTSAVNYVTNPALPKVYTLSGHGEAVLTGTMSAAASKQNIVMESLSLLTSGAVPEDCECLFILSPESDISGPEKEMILEYLQNGGNMLLITDYIDENGLPNIEELMEYYGVTAENGVVIEGDSDHCLYGYSHYLIPDISSHDITSPLLSAGYNFIIPVAQGLKISDELRDTLTVKALFTSSGDSYSKIAGYGMTTFEKEEGDIDGPFTLGAVITESADDIRTNIVWLPSSLFLDDTVNEYSSGANEDVFLNALNWMCGAESGVTIHAKSLDAQYLAVSGSAKKILTFAFVIFIPAMLIAMGAVTFAFRRRK